MQRLHLLLSEAGARPPEEHKSKAGYSWGARVLFVDPNLALEALRSLRSDPKAARNIMEYQTGFLNSNVSAINYAISEIVKQGTTITDLRTRTALTIIEFALKACRESFKGVQWDIDVVCARASELRAKVEEAKARAKGDVFGREGMDEVGTALKRASIKMKGVMNELTWWKMLWKVDEIGEIVSNAVRSVWCKELEEKVRVISFASLRLKVELVANILLLLSAIATYGSLNRFAVYLNLIHHPSASIAPLSRTSKLTVPTLLITLIPSPALGTHDAYPHAPISTDHLLHHASAPCRAKCRSEDTEWRSRGRGCSCIFGGFWWWSCRGRNEDRGGRYDVVHYVGC